MYVASFLAVLGYVRVLFGLVMLVAGGIMSFQGVPIDSVKIFHSIVYLLTVIFEVVRCSFGGVIDSMLLENEYDCLMRELAQRGKVNPKSSLPRGGRNQRLNTNAE